VNHFAGPVEYNSFDFLNKNRDTMSQDVVDCILQSESEYIATLFSESPKYGAPKEEELARQGSKISGGGRGGIGKKKVITVSSEFKKDMDDLMKIVTSTDPHFIRCIKPNGQQVPDVYDRTSVCEQLRYGGVLQAVQVSRAGYPVRAKHGDSWLDYKVLAPLEMTKKLAEIADEKKRIETLMDYLAQQIPELAGTVHGRRVWAVG
jgi:myosin heavy subunit